MSENPDKGSSSPTPEPVNPFKGLSRATVVGAVLGLAGIGLFLVFWTAFGQTGMQQYQRLLLSLCIPPAMIGIVILVYALVRQSRS